MKILKIYTKSMGVLTAEAESPYLNFTQEFGIEVASIEEAKATKKRLQANRDRRERHEMMTDLGLNRVKGALGRVYYE